MKLRIFDNQGETIDRYTVIIIDESNETEDVYTMSDSPNSPQGFNQYCCTVPAGDSEPNENEIELIECPESISKAVHQRFDQGN